MYLHFLKFMLSLSPVLLLEGGHVPCRSGTWMMTENGVMHNGTTIIDQYGQNLDRLQVGDRVGVMRKDNATLHFYVNGVDQGAAAMNVPEKIYGVIDLYGQAAQATIVDNTDFYSPTTNNSSFSNTTLYRFVKLRLFLILRRSKIKHAIEDIYH